MWSILSTMRILFSATSLACRSRWRGVSGADMTTKAKRDFVKKMHDANAEVFVCKNRNAVYAAGRAGQHFECKFVVTASFIVGAKPEKKASDGHRSIAMYLLD